METQEIHRGDWHRFLDEFSKLHQGETANLQVIGEDIGAQPEAEGLPFIGISSDDAGSAKGSISVMLGTEPEDHMEHRILDPTRLWLKMGGDEATSTIEIESTDGTKFILQLVEVPRLTAQ